MGDISSDYYKVDDQKKTFDIRCDIKVLMLPCRDGVKLQTLLYFPPGFSGKAPVLISRTPYAQTDNFELPSAAALAHGVIYIVQACRGSGLSEGDFDPAAFEVEKRDAEDFFNWLHQQEFFNGVCAMLGNSYPGWTQWCAAFTGEKSLAAINPHVAPLYGCVTSAVPGGGNWAGFPINWVLAMSHRRKYGSAGVPNYEILKVAWHLPLAQAYKAARYSDAPAYRNFVRYADEPGKIIDRHKTEFARVNAPALVSGGWFDMFKEQTIAAFKLLKKDGASESARKFTRLLLGPWGHCGLHNPEIFGVENDWRLLTAARDRFLFGRLLDPECDPMPEEPIVKYFMLGENCWHGAASWPPENMIVQKFYLHSGGNANIMDEDGVITTEPPLDNEPPDSYISDPSNPVLSYNGDIVRFNGHYDRRPTEKRDDVLVYTSGVLESDTRLAGEVEISFYASVEAPDTDFFAALSDVYPDGKSLFVTSGMIRFKFRNGLDHQELSRDNEVSYCRISLGNCAINLREGHRLRITLCGQDFPTYERNAQSGRAAMSDTELFAARCTIFHDNLHPAELTLPVLKM